MTAMLGHNGERFPLILLRLFLLPSTQDRSYNLYTLRSFLITLPISFRNRPARYSEREPVMAMHDIGLAYTMSKQ